MCCESLPFIIQSAEPFLSTSGTSDRQNDRQTDRKTYMCIIHKVRHSHAIGILECSTERDTDVIFTKIQTERQQAVR